MKLFHGRYLIPVLLMSVIIVSGCIFSGTDEEKDNDVPKVTYLNIGDGQSFDTRDIAVEWKGNTYSESYRYSLDGVQSAWIDTTAVLLTDLEEGQHELTVEAKKDTLISKPVTVLFEIDAIQGPGVLFSPRKVSGISYVSVYIEDADSLMAAHIEVAAVDDAAQFHNFLPESGIGTGGSLVIFSDVTQRGRLILDVGFGGIPEGASGRILLGRFILRPLVPGGEVSIDTEKTEFRGIDNIPVEVKGTDMVRIAQ